MKPASVKRLRLTLLALMLMGSSGCFSSSVAWLADSSGFVFTTNEGSRLVLYSLTRHARKVLVDDSGTQTPCPAISADGKRIALSKIESSSEKGSKDITIRQEIIIYDIHGKELKRSRPLISRDTTAVEATESKTWLSESALNWSGPPEKILLHQAIYDCVRDEWTKLDVNFWPVNNTPIRPDGKGFLASAKNGLVYVDWDGRVTQFADSPEKLDWGQMLGFEWNDKIARFNFDKGIVELDTEAMRGTFKTETAVFLEGEGKPSHIHRFPNSAVQLCVFSRKVNGDDLKSRIRIEAQIPNERKRRTILSEDELDDGPVFFFPSPDKKKVAFHIKDASHKVTIVVVNDSGVIIDRITP